MRQALCQEYLWNRAMVLSSAVSWSLWPSSSSAASVSRAPVVIFLSSSAVMVSSSEWVVVVPSRLEEPDNPSRGHTARRIGTPNTAAALTGRASDLCWREAKRPVSCGVIVHSTTACRWQSQPAADKRMTDTFGPAIHKATTASLASPETADQRRLAVGYETEGKRTWNPWSVSPPL